jgi:energy-coupling factor transporter ATP-binding protein EcfA2
MAKHLLAALETVGQIEAHLHDIALLQQQLEQVPLWRPAAVLKKQAIEAQQLIGAMQGRLDGRLVVTLIGPSGAGKSTLFNALAGQDDVSPIGLVRPTTRTIRVLTNDAHAARQALGDLADDQLALLADAPEHLILVDTPDTDSTLSPDHINLLHQVVARSDVLVCVFDAQNPHRRDHADFMAPLVARFNGASLIAAVNKCDRLSAQELTEVIGPAIEGYLKQAWESPPDAVLLMSARNNLKAPQWESQAKPRHHLDQFNLLKQRVFETLNQPGAGRDRRVANAGQIRDYVADQVKQAAAGHRAVLAQTNEKIAAAEHQALHSALERLRTDDRQQLLGVQVRLYQALAQRWLGPVGWLVAIWSRLIVFGSGLSALVRFGNPIRQLWGLFASWRRYKESRSALALLNDPDQVSAAMDIFRKTLLTRWPGIAEPLVGAGFDPAVRRLERAHETPVGRSLEALWADALDQQIHRYAKALSHTLLQLLFNIPGVVLMGYVGWLTATRFFSRNYLSADFFMHALLTISLVLLLSFFLLQVVVRLTAGRRRIQRRAFAVVEKAAAEQPIQATRHVAEQVDRVLALAGDNG